MPRETQSERIRRARRIARTLKRLYPARTALTHNDPFQLVVATILSAQCTDERVNAVTPELFARYQTPADFAKADPADVEQIIHSTGFFRAKTRHIIGAAQAIVEHHDGKVPRTLTELTRLPGVGRKTANVVLGTAYGLAEGVVVDTHVRRLSRRMRLTRHTDPAKIERDLMTLLPRSRWIEFSHRIIWHGRAICPARRPHCSECPLVPDCPTSREYLLSRPVRSGS
ncbi:MAG TPA: endonuclease III [Acidobacteriota bacterium]|nr:endonuclease III [Acidobacteriota bacterium]